MSVLGNGRPRGCVSCRQQPCAPRMSRGLFDRTPRDLGLGRRSYFLGASWDGVIVQWLAVVHDAHRPIGLSGRPALRLKAGTLSTKGT